MGGGRWEVGSRKMVGVKKWRLRSKRLLVERKCLGRKRNRNNLQVLRRCASCSRSYKSQRNVGIKLQNRKPKYFFISYERLLF